MFAALRRGEGYQKQYIEAQDNEGSTALMLAVQKGSLAVSSIVIALSICSVYRIVCFMVFRLFLCIVTPSSTSAS